MSLKTFATSTAEREAAGFRAITTRSTESVNDSRFWRNHSLTARLIWFLTTAFPTRRLTVTPRRLHSVTRDASGAAMSTTKSRVAWRFPDRPIRRNSLELRIRSVRPKRPVRPITAISTGSWQRGACGPSLCGASRSPGHRECYCEPETRAFVSDEYDSAGRSASSGCLPFFPFTPNGRISDCWSRRPTREKMAALRAARRPGRLATPGRSANRLSSNGFGQLGLPAWYYAVR
jgi:hypothetical protein